MLALPLRRALSTTLLLLSLNLLCVPAMAQSVSWESIKDKFVGGPYAGAGGMAVGGGSVGVEAFKDDAEAIKAIRLFPDVMMSFGGLGPDATDAEIGRDRALAKKRNLLRTCSAPRRAGDWVG